MPLHRNTADILSLFGNWQTSGKALSIQRPQMNSLSHTDTDSERRLTQNALRDEILRVMAPTCRAFLVEHRG